jgi:hypothetical protein
MPKTAGGLIGFVVTAVITVVIGLWIVNRVTFLQTVVAKKAAVAV